MDLEDQVPVLVFDILEANIPEDTSVVDKNIDTAKGLDRGVDDFVTVFNRIVVGNSLAAGLLDLVDDYICGLEWSSGQLGSEEA